MANLHIYYVQDIHTFSCIENVFSRTENQSQGTGCGVLYTVTEADISCIYKRIYTYSVSVIRMAG